MKTIVIERKKSDENIENQLTIVAKILDEKGYSFEKQLSGYLISGDPTYIPRYENSRNIIKDLGRDAIMEEIIDFYIKNHETLKK